MNNIFTFFVPWEFAWLVQFSVWTILWLYCRGLQSGIKPGYWSISAFFIGLLLMYLVTQTRFDYWSQYMFFVHRGQHLVLHHLAPLLIVLARPSKVLTAGMPISIQHWFSKQHYLKRGLLIIYRSLQQPIIACTLFVGLIWFWLTPSIHFDAMLSERLYWIMNWSMALDGLLFWWLMLENSHNGVTPRLRYGVRMLLLGLVMVPQIIIGARLAFSQTEWFDVYAICGRAWPLSPIADQQLGGLITWIPAAMMSVIAALIVLRFMLKEDSTSIQNGAYK